MSDSYLNYFKENFVINYFPPCQLLQPFIEEYVYFSFPKDKLTNTHLHPYPNGYFELFLCLGDSSLLIKNNEKEFNLKCFMFCIFALTDRTLFKVQTTDAYYSSVMVRLKMGTIKNFLKGSLSKYKNKLIDVEELWGNKGIELKSFLNINRDISETINGLNIFFESLLDNNQNIEKEDFTKILDHCQLHDGILRVEELSNYSRIPYRTIHRLFISEMGISPKEYLKILRFNKVCRIINENNELEWSELIYSCGYYDQAHFIHDFKEIMKFTPDVFYQITQGKFYLKRPYCLVD